MISFIVPAYNEERLLGATLGALHATAKAVGEPAFVFDPDGHNIEAVCHEPA
jgi:hypothetical protein